MHSAESNVRRGKCDGSHVRGKPDIRCDRCDCVIAAAVVLCWLLNRSSIFVSVVARAASVGDYMLEITHGTCHRCKGQEPEQHTDHDNAPGGAA